MQFTWTMGRRLESATRSDGITISYTYNADGLRTGKTINNVPFKYYWNGGKLTAQTWGGNTMYFRYDGDTPIGFEFNGTEYYYVTNLQGDIIAILDSNGAVAAEYEYDAWGNCTVTKDTNTIAYINPIRYRGYYYDSDTDLYYLQSRYYDANTGRFINADEPEMILEGETNLFVYCGNNPVNRHDYSGMFWKELWEGVKNTWEKAKIVIRNISVNVSKAANLFFRSQGFDTAAAGAYFLQMYKDKRGVYHATFDSWQQYFGYNDLYDFVFDVFTYMKSEKFDFTYDGKKYILWLWKGNYLNLGLGAEIGIYYGGEPHWRVDKSLAMIMSMTVFNNGKMMLYYCRRTWWLTGFKPDPRYYSDNISKLTVLYRVVFKDEDMYYAFKDAWGKDWDCDDQKLLAIYKF